MDLSVVIPVYNEAESIRALCEEVSATLNGRLTYEIVVVDDGSSDTTPGVLASLRLPAGTLRTLRHAANVGQSAALITGVRAARAPWVVTLDGDGQNDPADILRVSAYVALPDATKPVLIAGWRYQRQDSMLRRWSSRIANTARSRLLGDGAPDTGCGLKLCQRELFLELPRFDHMHRFLPALARRAGAEVITVPVGHRKRVAGHSKYGLFDRLGVGLIDLLGVLWLKRRACRAHAEEVRP